MPDAPCGAVTRSHTCFVLCAVVGTGNLSQVAGFTADKSGSNADTALKRNVGIGLAM